MRLFFETGGQAFVFLLMAYGGAFLGLLLDGALLFHRSRGGWRAAALDASACLVAGGAVAWALVYTGQAGLRGYGLLGMLCGWLVYDLGLRSLLALAGRWLGRHIAAPLARWLQKQKKKQILRRGKKQAGKTPPKENI